MSLRRGLNTIRAALNHAVQTYSDLKSYQVPRSPLTKKSEQERDRVLSDEEISKISAALSAKHDWADALFFFQNSFTGTLGLLSGAAAMSFRKGSRRHRVAGNVFFHINAEHVR